MNSQTLYIWVLLVVGVLIANLPFLSQRVFLIITLSAGKPTLVRFIELGIYYALWLGLGMLMEWNLSSISAVSWEFYPITACMFLVFAYPGFVVRYLRKRNRVMAD